MAIYDSGSIGLAKESEGYFIVILGGDHVHQDQPGHHVVLKTNGLPMLKFSMSNVELLGEPCKDEAKILRMFMNYIRMAYQCGKTGCQLYEITENEEISPVSYERKN